MPDCISPIRIVFMGTPAFALPSLRALHRARTGIDWAVVGVVTQPDRPAGRGRKLVASPIKEYALAQDIPVLQPGRLRREPDAVAALEALAPDLIVVTAYGQILPPSVLSLPSYGCINVHASLLPAYRGASPISAAILAGLETTGVTIMLMDEGMDTGPVLAWAAQPIEEADTTETLGARLSRQGAELLVETLPRWLLGRAAPIDQSEMAAEPSTCSLVKKRDGRIDWKQPAVHIERMVRAYTPWPSAYTSWNGEPFKIWQAGVLPGHAPPGAVQMTERGPIVGTGQGLLWLRQVQPAGKRSMDVGSFVNGAPDFVGSVLGQELDHGNGEEDL